jgi:hypothetical protein
MKVPMILPNYYKFTSLATGDIQFGLIIESAGDSDIVQAKFTKKFQEVMFDKTNGLMNQVKLILNK